MQKVLMITQHLVEKMRVMQSIIVESIWFPQNNVTLHDNGPVPAVQNDAYELTLQTEVIFSAFQECLEFKIDELSMHIGLFIQNTLLGQFVALFDLVSSIS
jgi:hypothetical protein